MKIGLASRKLLSISSFLALRSSSSAMAMSTTNMSPLSSSQSKSKSSLNIHITSYNVLSSHLSEPAYYATLNPDHLNPVNRLPVVLNKLEEEIENHNSSIICLQEVSHDWAGSLHTYFANKGYHMVTGLYGRHFNGYMGVATAFKLSDYTILDVDISRLADKRENGWPKKPKEKSNIIKNIYKGIYNSLSSTIKSIYFSLSGTKPKRITDPWFMSQNRFNQLVTVKLQDKKTKKSFAVGNYHMPCAFFAPQVMTIHTDLAARHVQRLASSSSSSSSTSDGSGGAVVMNDNDNGNNDENEKNNDETPTTSSSSSMPYILAGDWNIKPGDASYNLLTTGMMDKGAPEWPTPKYGMEWNPTSKPMRSAYAVASSDGKTEPDFTNYARVKEDEPFIDTLDYFFISDEWNVSKVKSLPHRDDCGGPFPNLDHNEPSDHILIAANLEL